MRAEAWAFTNYVLNMSTNKVLLFNPRSANAKHRIPNSILQIAGAIHAHFSYVIVDGNLERDPAKKIRTYMETQEFAFFGVTVMPGPQLKEAIPISRMVKERYPKATIIWGGYFASNQYEVCLQSGFVDFIINGPGDHAFPALLQALSKLEPYGHIQNIIYRNGESIIKTPKQKLLDQDSLPPLPYTTLNEFYPVREYLARTFMWEVTLSYHSSMGCPFTCSFCGIVPIFNAAWKGKSAENIYADVRYFKETYGIDAIEFHDNNFFTSKKRVLAFSELIMGEGIKYWGEGRIDTINRYSDDELRLMKEAGCTMIFLGAETGNDEVLKQMNKGGTQSGEMIKAFAARMKKVGIIPEMSFVLGMPGPSEEAVYQQILWDINFIKEIKAINPDTEIIIYLYSPTPTKGSELYHQIVEAGFQFPETIEEWISPSWENFDLRKNPLTPWLKPYMIDTIKNFETVLNGKFPTVSDFRVKGLKKQLLQWAAHWRYSRDIYKYPYEIKAMQKLWKYRQPEIQGFYSE